MKKFIMNALGLTVDQFDLIDSISTINEHDVLITLKRFPHNCPHCDTITSHVKGYQMKKISHNILINKDTFIFYNCRRYFCIKCNSSFIENSPITINSKSKISSKTIINVLEDLKPFNETFSSVARRYNLSVTKVINFFDTHVQIPRKKFTHYLCMDEFYFNRHSKYKYAFMIMDFEKKVILDIVESRHFDKLSNYFFNIPLSERSKVQYICIDMYPAYLSLASIYFKNATICIDPFHAVKRVNDALNQVRKRILRSYPDKDCMEYKLLKYRYKVLLKNKSEIDMYTFQMDRILQYHATENMVLELLLKIHPNIKKAHKLKESFIKFNSIGAMDYNQEIQDKKFTKLINDMRDSNIDEFIECAKTLKNWNTQILNSFIWINDRRISNGPIEGKNNYLKKMMNNANGFTNFERARNRFIYSQNLFEKYSLSMHQPIIKNTKKGGKK